MTYISLTMWCETRRKVASLTCQNGSRETENILMCEITELIYEDIIHTQG